MSDDFSFSMRERPIWRLACIITVLALWPSAAHAQRPAETGPRSKATDSTLDSTQAIDPEQKPVEKRDIERAVDRALKWISTQQQADGSFASIPVGQPGVTGLCVLAYLSRGHQPGLGPYGNQINKAVDFVLSCQQGDGLLSQTSRGQGGSYPMMHAALYNHAIGSLMLSEVYGTIGALKARQTGSAISSALNYCKKWQKRMPRRPGDAGGWRYLRIYGESDSDLSVTAWLLMFYRSAKNAEFDVPAENVAAAVSYVKRCFDGRRNLFVYGLFDGDRNISRAMTGAGILSLALAGEHQTAMARGAGDWVLQQSFERYNAGSVGKLDRYHYSAYYCSQAMFQLGGDYWNRFYPPLARTLLAHQRPDGSWEPESNRDGQFGNAYTTALAVLALTPPYQLLPIYQR